ncbi:hypothetical protein [Candidatus Magnetomonas plexicatena]|uniref:hypothetical protein n=1 Tax=Candidatus Magnetomonas plexicatena TaxID=2552947 RepID=UPI00110144CD|nr:hypothetical protein E2O03_011625 [Nitrospirales bacterium LBB_01]
MKNRVIVIASQALMMVGDYIAVTLIFAHYAFRAKQPNILVHGPISRWFAVAALISLFAIFYFIVLIKKIKKQYSVITCFLLSFYCPLMLFLMSLTSKQDKAATDYIGLIFSPAALPSAFFVIAGLLLYLVPAEQFGTTSCKDVP